MRLFIGEKIRTLLYISRDLNDSRGGYSMFSKKDTPAADKIETIIGKDTHVTGSLSGHGMIRIDGVIEGDEIKHGEVIVGESGKISADVYVKKITIAGAVTGNITAEDRVEIVGTGKVIGNIHAAYLIINEGAHFKGSSEMKMADNQEPVEEILQS
jgi:cytoskeletal protein CcmA (bactofilin family)